jgi:hypothetical protein
MSIRPFWMKHPYLLKLVALMLLLTGPIWIALVTLWQERREIKACFKELWDLLR